MKMTKTAIVTGASQGIGRAVAKRLARDGFAVVVKYANNTAQAGEVVNDIQNAGGTAIALQADISKTADAERMFDETMKNLGGVEVVVHNAGIMELSPIVKGDVELFDKIMATNLRGTFLVFVQAARHVISGGRVIALSSSIVPRALPTDGAYVASKAGVEGLVHVLANEMRGRNITVNAVAPGPTETKLSLAGKSEVLIDQMAKGAPLERLGKPEDIARVVSFLAGPDGGWVNSQVVPANGGMV
jgi:3-oxoacyl-[acyl-carrier protein] reductase